MNRREVKRKGEIERQRDKGKRRDEGKKEEREGRRRNNESINQSSNASESSWELALEPSLDKFQGLNIRNRHSNCASSAGSAMSDKRYNYTISSNKWQRLS